MRAVLRSVKGVDPGIVVAGIVAVVVLWLAYDDGSYQLASRATLAIVVWWAVILGIAFSLFGRIRVPRATWVVGVLLVALAYWSLSSTFWAPSVEDAFHEFNRVALYLGTYVLVVLAATRSTIGRWADGLAIAIAGVAGVALVSRLFPDSFDDGDLATLLPSAVTRLSFPLGYWNGLAIFVALGLPLLLRVALVGRNPVVRGLGLVPVPAVACVVYLASSRGGVFTAFVGTLAFLLLSERRWSVAAAIAAGGAGAAVAIAVLLGRDELVNGPLGTEVVTDQGRSGALLIGLACVATGVAYGVGCRLLGSRFAPGAWAGRIAVGSAVVVAVAVVVTSEPVDRFETFKAKPGQGESIDRGDYVTSHLLSSGGSGRWQFWSTAVDAWEDSPVSGVGAGSYEHWWAEHATHTQFVRDAHSLYLESLGELGIPGFLLIVALAVTGIGVGIVRTRRSSGDGRATCAALTALFAAYAAAAGIDWVWELTVVSVIAIVALGLVTGPAAEPLEPLRVTAAGEKDGLAMRRRFGLGLVVGLFAWIFIVAQAIPLLVDRELVRSQEAVARGDFDEGLEAAEVARDLEPWAASPYLQLALVSEQQDELGRARGWIGEAIDRDEQNWRLWLVSARLETKVGNVENAERSLRRAAELNPRSPLFVGLLDELNESG